MKTEKFYEYQKNCENYKVNDMPTPNLSLLTHKVGNIVKYLEYLSQHINDLGGYIDFIKSSNEISFYDWRKIKDDEEKIKSYKREKSINEIIGDNENNII